MNEKKSEESSAIGLSKKINDTNDTKKTIVKVARKKPNKEPSTQKVGDVIAKPAKVQNPKVQNPKVQNPKVQNPKVQNPKVQNAKVQNAKVQNAKSPIKTSKKPPSNAKLDNAPKSTSSDNNASIPQESAGNKNKSASPQQLATNTPTTNNTNSHKIENINPEKPKKNIPRAYKPKKSVENIVESTLKPQNTTKRPQLKNNKNLDNSTVNINENIASSPSAEIELKINQTKDNSNILSNDATPINSDNNVSSTVKNTLTKNNQQNRTNTNFKKIKPHRNTTPNVGKFNNKEQMPSDIEKNTPEEHHISKTKTQINKTQKSIIKTHKPINQEQADVPQKSIDQTQNHSAYEQKSIEQTQNHSDYEQKSIEQTQNHSDYEQKSIEQTQANTIQEQKNTNRSQAKPRRPRNYNGARHHAPKEIINEQNAHMGNNTSNEVPDHKASNIPVEKGPAIQSKNNDTKSKNTIAPKVLPKATKHRQCKMLISVVPGEQVEVIVIENNTIDEYYLEMSNQKKTKGNIYKGIIHNIDTNLQAAFINYGTNKNGFLQIDEVHPEYYISPQVQTKGRKFPLMQKVLKTKQEVLVQVVKEPSGSKGAFLTTWPSLAGRFLVLTPGQTQIGVSRKVVDEEERVRLRNMINGLDPGEGLGVIIRTASEGISKTTLKNDLQYLKRLWKEIRKKVVSETAPSLVYQELALAERAMRDYLNDDIFEVWVDDASVADSLRETASLLFPRKKNLIKVHTDVKQSLWERFNIQQQLEQIYSREVILPSGGRLIFDQTEALMAIDINSGKISGKNNFETMALKTNVEAAECIAHQLKLRDVGGQIVIDFIEMRDKKHIRDVEKTLRNAMRNDRARHDVGRISSFGLLEMIRQRTASSAIAVSTEPCPLCAGTGIRRNIEWQALQTIRNISRSITNDKKSIHQVELPTELALYFLNHKRESLHALEKQYGIKIEIKVKP